MVFVVCASLAVIIAGGVAYFRSLEYLPFALGAVMGAGLNVVKILLMERTVDKSVVMEKSRAENYLRLQYLLRYLLTGAVLIAAVFVPFLNLWGAALGILTMPVATFFVRKMM